MNRQGVLQSLGAAAVGAAGPYFAMNWSRQPVGSYVQMGTSVTAGVTESASITPTIVGNRLNMLGINAGLHGACVGHHKFPEIDQRSLFSLVDALVSGDWSRQSVEADAGVKLSFSRLLTADLSKVTYLGLEYGTNDLAYCRPIGSNTDATCETFKGALNYSLKKLSAAFPRLRLFLIAPAWRLNFENLDSDTNPNEIGLFLKDYVDAMLDVAARHHVPCLDLWRTLGVNINNYKTFTFDGTHPTQEGSVRRGEVIASFVKATF